MNENLRQLFKTVPTKYELLDNGTLVVYFQDVSARIKVQEKGCCVGKYFKWSLDCEVSENGGRDYTTYRDYVLIESLKNNEDIQLNKLIKGCNI